MPSTKRPPASTAPVKKKRTPYKPVPAPFKKPRGGGRPTLYEKEAHCTRVTQLALLGLTDEEIAHQFGITVDTFYRWTREHRAFSDALKAGKINADSEVAASLFNRATGRVKIPAVKVSFDDDGQPLYAPYVQHFPPDVGAQKLWLLNRRPKDWRERKEVEVTGSLEHRLAQMTPEERRARLLELQARAAITIEGEATEGEE